MPKVRRARLAKIPALIAISVITMGTWFMDQYASSMSSGRLNDTACPMTGINAADPAKNGQLRLAEMAMNMSETARKLSRAKSPISGRENSGVSATSR